MDYSEVHLKVQALHRDVYNLLLKERTGQASQAANDLVMAARVLSALVEEEHQRKIAPRTGVGVIHPPGTGVD
jgi:hypothetical protein